MQRRHSSVAERLSSKQEVMSSNLIGGFLFFCVLSKLQTAVMENGQREETESLNGSMWRQPEVNTAQILASPETPAKVKAPDSTSFKTPSLLQFLVNHKEFCKRYKLIFKYNEYSGMEHIQQVNSYCTALALLCIKKVSRASRQAV